MVIVLDFDLNKCINFLYVYNIVGIVRYIYVCLKRK